MTEFYGRADGLPDVGPIGIKTFYGKAAPDVPIVENLTFGPSAATNFLLSGGYTTTSWNSGVSTGTWTFAFNDWMTAAENEWKHLVGNTAISIGDSVYFRLNGRQNTGGTTGDVFYLGLVSGSADQNIINTGWTGNTDEQRLGFRLVLSTNLSRSEGAFIFGSTNADGQLIINGALDDNIEIAIQYVKSDEVNEQQTLLFNDDKITVQEVRGTARGGFSATYSLVFDSSRNNVGTTIATDVIDDSAFGNLATISNAVVPRNTWIWARLSDIQDSTTNVMDEVAINVRFNK